MTLDPPDHQLSPRIQPGTARGLSNFGGLIGDSLVRRAISSIVQRSDLVVSNNDLAETYVDVGVQEQLDNSNHQVVFGRRGTGKSHIFRMLAQTANKTEFKAATYIDLRIIGSASIVSGAPDQLTQQALNVFRDILANVRDRLLQSAFESSKSAMEALTDLQDAIFHATSEVQQRTVTESQGVEADKQANAGLSASVLHGVGASIGGKKSQKESNQVSYVYDEVVRDSVIFSRISHHLTAVLEELGCSCFYILLDEWSSLPLEMQPYVAEYIKRAILPSRRVAVKIAALSFRSRFAVTDHEGAQVVGIELGGDIAANIDIDDYYVFDKSPDFVTEVFVKILYLHLILGLPDKYLEFEYGITDPALLRQNLFDSRSAFSESIRAGEGVVRDFFGVLTKAFQIARVRDRILLDSQVVESAASAWYEDDKVRRLTGLPLLLLRELMETAVNASVSRYFLMEETQTDNERLGALVDQRVLHLIRRGYNDMVSPGTRYNIYAFDFGSFVNFKQGIVRPRIHSAVGDKAEDVCLLFGENSAVPRVVIDLEALPSFQDPSR